MTASLLLHHPAFLFILAAVLMPLFQRLRIQKAVLVVVPLIAIYQINCLPPAPGACQYLGLQLSFIRSDQLTYIFLNVFTIMAFIGAVYSLHVKDWAQHTASFLYVAGSLGVTLCGDYVTLFVFWELMALASTFLIWLRRSPQSQGAGLRYLLVHIVGGLLLLAGIVLKYSATRDLSFVQVPVDAAGIADYFIMAGFMLNAAVPPLHAWLADAYPEATVCGSVFMCAFTTKTAVYVLCRAFPGFEVLAVMGAIMAVYGVCFAIIENDARRILSYHIISQVGYMVCGIGIGTDMAVNGACAHAYAHILYKALLFMGVGCVLEMTGKQKLSELGGLWRRMPLAMIFTVIGGISISGFPFTSGFVSKSMIISGAGEAHRIVLFVMLMLASVGTFLSVGIKLPYFLWFGKDSGVPAKDAPWNMTAGMAIAAFFCFFIGCYPEFLYRMLPLPCDYKPYTAYHFSETLQVLGYTGLGFYLLRNFLTPHATMNLDIDWFYRKGAQVVMRLARGPISAVDGWVCELYRTAGMRSAMGAARGFTGFDVHVIDYLIDGFAGKVVVMGEHFRNLQTGKVQHYIAAAVIFIFLLLICVVLI
jgi:multicomponent Na+:H+ antiporter subunit D